ncbi:hypothetical protein HK096_011155 [Nowakowskiella sp. JEL0078]|nr:hypothetical protein HK096_011155 [Nowakowskiella sp. JEL0078]
MYRNELDFCLFGIYVDDIPYTGTPAGIAFFCNLIGKEFDVLPYGLTKSILSLQIERFGLTDSHSQNLLLATETSIGKQKNQIALPEYGKRYLDERPLDPKVPYQKVIGNLIWRATVTKPDISYAVHVFA